MNTRHREVAVSAADAARGRAVTVTPVDDGRVVAGREQACIPTIVGTLATLPLKRWPSVAVIVWLTGSSATSNT